MNIPKIIKAFGQIDDKFLLEAEKAERLSPVRFRLESVLLAAVISVVARNHRICHQPRGRA